MTLDVDIPDPPSLRAPQQRGDYEAIDMTDQTPTDDYRHAELESFLGEGAWRDAFEEWSETTLLSEEAFDEVRERNLIEEFDFYWDPSTDEVGYRVPVLSDADRDAFEDPDGVAEALDGLARTVSEVLENDYLLRDEESYGFFAQEESPGE